MNKPRIRVSQAHHDRVWIIRFAPLAAPDQQYGRWECVTNSDIDRHGSIFAYMEHLYKIGCNYTADKIANCIQVS